MNTPKQFTAADVLLYLFSDCASWKEDVDGDAREDGTPYAIVHHDIRIGDSHLAELLDMAGLDELAMETSLDRIKRHCAASFAISQG